MVVILGYDFGEFDVMVNDYFWVVCWVCSVVD